MSVVFSPEALQRLEDQLQHIRDQHAPDAAERLRTRVLSFLEDHLALFPRAGSRMEDELWEIWIPQTKLVVWYEIHDNDVVIMSVWHAAQNRKDQHHDVE